MYEYIEGVLKEKNPAYCVIETGGFGYFIQISLTTYSQIEPHTHAKVYLHQVVREDAHLLLWLLYQTGARNVQAFAYRFRNRCKYCPHDAFIHVGR